MRKRVITAAAGVVGLVVIGLGVASATVWRADDVLTATTTASSHVVVTDPGVLELGGDPATVRVTAADGAEVVVVVGRDTDVDGWVGSDRYTRVTGLSAWDALATTPGQPDPSAAPTDAPTPAPSGSASAAPSATPAPSGSASAAPTAAASAAATQAASAAATPAASATPTPQETAAAAEAPAAPTQASPAGNDNWVAQAMGDGSAELVWPAQPGRWSLLAVSRGTAEPTLSISWPRVVTTPWLWPCVVVGGLITLAAGLLLLRDVASRRQVAWEPVLTDSVPVVPDGTPLTRRQLREAQQAAQARRPATGALPRVTGPQQTVAAPHEEGRHAAAGVPASGPSAQRPGETARSDETRSSAAAHAASPSGAPSGTHAAPSGTRPGAAPADPIGTRPGAAPAAAGTGLGPSWAAGGPTPSSSAPAGPAAPTAPGGPSAAASGWSSSERPAAPAGWSPERPSAATPGAPASATPSRRALRGSSAPTSAVPVVPDTLAGAGTSGSGDRPTTARRVAPQGGTSQPATSQPGTAQPSPTLPAPGPVRTSGDLGAAGPGRPTSPVRPAPAPGRGRPAPVAATGYPVPGAPAAPRPASPRPTGSGAPTEAVPTTTSAPRPAGGPAAPTGGPSGAPPHAGPTPGAPRPGGWVDPARPAGPSQGAADHGGRTRPSWLDTRPAGGTALPSPGGWTPGTPEPPQPAPDERAGDSGSRADAWRRAWGLPAAPGTTPTTEGTDTEEGQR